MSVKNASGYNNFPLPIGSIFAYAGNSAVLPPSYLICEGQEVAQAFFPELFDVIGTTYGVATLPFHFIIPNLSVSFVQGSTVSGVLTAPTGTATVDPFFLTADELPTINAAETGAISGNITDTGGVTKNVVVDFQGYNLFSTVPTAQGIKSSSVSATSSVTVTQTDTPIFAFNSGVTQTAVQFPSVPLNPTSSPAAYEITYIIKAK